MKNPWKIAFWSCLILLITITLFSAYSVLDQGVSLTYLRDDHSRTEHEMAILLEILDDSGLSKQQVLRALKENELPHLNSDTIYLEKVMLIFERDSLVKAKRIYKNSFPTR